jgi:release factor glutamine methyltransferase
MDKAQNVASYLQWATGVLTEAEVDSPRFDAELLLAEALNVSRKALYIDPDRKLNSSQRDLADRLVKRRASREPMAYILRQREFWGRAFQVNQHVLIPRPETEVLIEAFLKWNNKIAPKQPVRILDVGTGSGAIAVTLACEIPDCQVVATDISSQALAVAKTNAITHNVDKRIQFIEDDIFPAEPLENFDAILSNPPYIDSGEISRLMPDVGAYEPVVALDGGPEGLAYYRRMVPASKEYLNDNGLLMLEIGQDQASAVVGLFQQDFSTPTVLQDYSGCDRVVLAEKGGYG